MDQLRNDFRRRPWLAVALLALLAVYGYTCGHSPTGATRAVPSGAWGGTGISLAVNAEGATVEFDCAHGTISGGPPTINADGRFEAAGAFVRERPGPVRVDETPDSRPARYSGTTDGRTMTLTITLTESGQIIGPFELTFGRTPRLFKCR